MIGPLFDSIHRALGRRRTPARLAIKLRNQCRSVIKYHLGGNPDPLTNGEAWLVRQVAPQSLTFVDVGANVGNWADLFLQSAPDDCRGLLFDPSDVAFEKLSARFGQSESVQLIKAALGDRAGELPFWEEPGGGETSSLSPHGGRRGFVEKIVTVRTLDEEVEERRWGNVDFVKVDAEGHDLHVLRGASGLLSRQRIRVVQFEYGEFWSSAGSTLAAALNLLRSFRYQVFLLKATGLHELDYGLYGEYYSYSNYVAVAPAAMPLLRHAVKART